MSKQVSSKPTEYHAEFYFSKISKIGYILLSLFLVGLACLILSKKNTLISLFLVLMSAYFVYRVLIENKNKEPKLKLAKQGLWTKELGFVLWEEVQEIKFTTDISSGRSVSSNLDIYLKNNQVNFPSDRICLDNLAKDYRVRPLIEMLFKQ